MNEGMNEGSAVDGVSHSMWNDLTETVVVLICLETNQNTIIE